MKILSATTALPLHYYPQKVLIDAFRKYWGGRLDRFDVLTKLHAAAQVDGRYLALPLEEYPQEKWGDSNNAWIKVSLDLGEEAISKALAETGVAKEDIGAFFFVSITGVCSPSIEARLINRMKLSTRMKRIPIFGLGCVAGAAGIARAADYVKAFPKEACLLLSVELCSLTVQQDDLSPANLVSTGLFGDGAAAVLVAGSEYEAPVAKSPAGPEIIATRSTFYNDTEDVMGWDISEKGFRIVLSREVPDVVVKNLGRDAHSFLAEHGLKREDIKSWVIHTGELRRLKHDSLDFKEHAQACSGGADRRSGFCAIRPISSGWLSSGAVSARSITQWSISAGPGSRGRHLASAPRQT
jgi:alkylresorcinol/alkylpyrone synthase